MLQALIHGSPDLRAAQDSPLLAGGLLACLRYLPASVGLAALLEAWGTTEVPDWPAAAVRWEHWPRVAIPTGAAWAVVRPALVISAPGLLLVAEASWSDAAAALVGRLEVADAVVRERSRQAPGAACTGVLLVSGHLTRPEPIPPPVHWISWARLVRSLEARLQIPGIELGQRRMVSDLEAVLMGRGLGGPAGLAGFAVPEPWSSGPETLAGWQLERPWTGWQGLPPGPGSVVIPGGWMMV